MTQNASNLCWLDMEMTGLDPERERIIEVAMIITDSDLNVLAQSEVYAVHQSDELLDGMDEWNTATHGRTGLTRRVRESRLTEAEVEQKLLDFIAMDSRKSHADVRQFHPSRPPLHGQIHAAPRSIFPLP